MEAVRGGEGRKLGGRVSAVVDTEGIGFGAAIEARDENFLDRGGHPMETIEENLFTLRKKFIKDLQGVISAKKIIKLKKAEEDFNRHLLKQMREKRKG